MNVYLPRWLLLMVFATNAFADEVCYQPLGCFTNDFPYTSPRRPVPHLPWSPEEIGTEFRLFTRYNQFGYHLLSYSDAQTIVESTFSPFRKTKFIVHGFTSQGAASWVLELKNAILGVDNANVIIVDWSKGADPNKIYGQAATNTRVVGAQIAHLINVIKDNTGALASDFHVIGHSLGAHVAGYAGRELFNLGRITGLDPADPYFQGTPIIVRLDPTDARYVDVIHTDGDPFLSMGWGMIDPVGHADFYPNGGVDQPGCPGNEVEDGQWWKVACSHERAHDLLIDSIINPDKPMRGYRCADYQTFLEGKCNTCDANGCPALGYYSNEVASSSETLVKYFLTTASESPYGIV
ncbi:inactive pancreatic lipase-related protein 1-like [Styela clava]